MEYTRKLTTSKTIRVEFEDGSVHVVGKTADGRLWYGIAPNSDADLEFQDLANDAVVNRVRELAALPEKDPAGERARELASEIFGSGTGEQKPEIPF